VDVSPAMIELASRRRPIANIDDRIADLVDNRPGSGRVHVARRALTRRLRALTLRQRRDALELYRQDSDGLDRPSRDGPVSVSVGIQTALPGVTSKSHIAPAKHLQICSLDHR
jgi:hypothetical protein